MLLADPSKFDKLEGLEELPVMDSPLEQRPDSTCVVRARLDWLGP